MSEPKTSRGLVEAFRTILARLQKNLPHAAEEISLPNGLAIQAEGAPSWWRENNNILLAPMNEPVPFPSYVGSAPPQNAIVILGPNCTLPNQLLLLGDGPIVFLGPRCSLPNGTIICGGDSIIVLAGNLFAINAATLDARNGGMIYVGDDNLWSSNIKINTDDMHAIFDRNSLRRINRYGSTVTIGTHVWLGLDVLINPGVAISDNVVIGSRSVVTKAIPTGCVAVGAPARIVKRKITWTREDLRPGTALTDLNITPPAHALRWLGYWLRRAMRG